MSEGPVIVQFQSDSGDGQVMVQRIDKKIRITITKEWLNSDRLQMVNATLSRGQATDIRDGIDTWLKETTE